MAKVITISSISDYIQKVCGENSKVREYSYFRDDSLLFRGQASKDYELMPSIGRNRHSSVSYTIFNEERNLIEMAKFRMPDVFRNDLSPVELLALLQHHGIPTRLLDVTENALVALYFACSDRPDKDGEVIIFKCTKEYVTNYPVVNAIADTYRFTNGSDTPLARFYADVKGQSYFLEQRRMLDVIHKDDNAGGKWIAQCCSEIMYLYAPIRSNRQQVQHGRFILFPNHIDTEHKVFKEDCFEWKIDAIPKDHSDIVGRIIIPKEIKRQLMIDLSVLGVTKGFLFGDNVDVVCEEIVNTLKRRTDASWVK